MLTIFYILIILQIAAGLYSLVNGIHWLRLARRRAGHHPGFFGPRVALICPCKGLEPGLEENLTALTQFDYPDYEIFFALANGSDPAQGAIKRVAAKSKHTVHVVVAGPPTDTSEKVHNLSAAVAQVSEAFAVLVFTDSDARPGRQWLKRLVAPLADSKLGATTTYRWFLPGRGGFWSAVGSAWNAPVVTLLGDHDRNFCWGGGTAIRRQMFDEVKTLEFWKGSASDDYSLTHALRNSARPIEFVPECLTVTRCNVNFDQLMEFTSRQIILTRVYEPRLWLNATILHSSYSLTLLYAFWVCVTVALETGLGRTLLLLTLLVPLLAAVKGMLRLLAVADLLPENREELLRNAWIWTLLAPLVPFLLTWNLLEAAFVRRIRWRGIRYQLISPNQTRVLSR